MAVLPLSEGVEIIFSFLCLRREVLQMAVTWTELLQFCILIIALLTYLSKNSDDDNKKR